MAPPDLAADAPVLDVAHPLEVGVLPVLRHEADAAVLDRLDRRLGQRLDLARTTGRSGRARSPRRSGRRAAPSACVGRSSPAGPAPRDRRRSACAPRSGPGRGSAGIRRPRLVVHDRGVDGEDVDQAAVDWSRSGLVAVALPHCVVVEVVRRRDLDAAGAELRIDVLVGDDRDARARSAAARPARRPGAGSARRPGCTATALSPSMVSGRVVATTRWPWPSASG